MKVYVDGVGDIGGAELFMYEVAKVLYDNYDVSLICSSLCKDCSKVEEICNEVINLTSITKTFYRKLKLYDNWYIIKSFILKKYIDNVDVSFFHSFLVPNTINSNKIVVFDGRDWNTFSNNLSTMRKLHISLPLYFRKKFYNDSNYIIVFNEENLLWYKRLFGEEKVILLPQSVFVDKLHHQHNPTYDFGYIGRFTNEKNPYIIIDTFKNTHFKGILIGNDQELKISNNITIKPFMDRNSVYKLISKFKVGIIPSIIENFPRVIVEYLGSGVPVLKSDSIKTPLDKFTLEFKCCDKIDLYEKYIHMIENYNYYKRLAEKGRKYVMKKHDKNKNLKRVFKLILNE